jgi:hypothetical protein
VRTITRDVARQLGINACALVDHAIARSLAGDTACLAALINLLSTQELIAAQKRLSSDAI